MSEILKIMQFTEISRKKIRKRIFSQQNIIYQFLLLFLDNFIIQTRSVGSVITVKTMCKQSFITFVVAINYYEAFFAI